jgi:TatD DNase family protein
VNVARLANLTDSHCHLTSPQLRKDIPAVLDRARNAGITRMLTVGQGLEDSIAAIELAQQNSDVFAAIGFGPHGAEHVSKSDFMKLAELASTTKVLALGEAGLDYYYGQPSSQIQRAVFAEQVRLAAELSLPLIIHCRDAWDDCLAILDENSTGVFHCYTGSPELIRQLIDRGFYISFAGMITFKNAKDCQTSAKKVPPDRLLIETDAPYLSPQPMRKVKPNEPSLLVHTARFMAELLGRTAIELAELTTNNAGELFRWPQ